VWDEETRLQEGDGGGGTDRQYLTTGDQYGDLVSAYGGGQTAYYAADPLGSTELLLDGSGAAADRYAYRAFGLAAHMVGSDSQPFTWVGRSGYQQDSETDLYFLRARYYDPAVGHLRTQATESPGKVLVTGERLMPQLGSLWFLRLSRYVVRIWHALDSFMRRFLNYQQFVRAGFGIVHHVRPNNDQVDRWDPD
jgi:uncharacterized protein RhaS with RHS repeats